MAKRKKPPLKHLPPRLPKLLRRPLKRLLLLPLLRKPPLLPPRLLHRLLKPLLLLLKLPPRLPKLLHLPLKKPRSNFCFLSQKSRLPVPAFFRPVLTPVVEDRGSEKFTPTESAFLSRNTNPVR